MFQKWVRYACKGNVHYYALCILKTEGNPGCLQLTTHNKNRKQAA